MPGAPPAWHRPSVTGRFSRAAPPNAGDTLHGAWQRCPPPLADSRSPCCLSCFFYSAHVHRGSRLLLHMHRLLTGCRCLYSSVAERQSCKLKVLGSIPSGGCAASTLQVAMHGGTVNTCVSLAVLIAFSQTQMELPTSFQVRRAKFGTRRPGARCASSWASPFCDGPLLKSSAHPPQCR